MNSPRPKPKQAPGIEPARKPTEAASSGVRSAGRPKIDICETAVELQDPADQREQREPHVCARRRGHLHRRPQVGLRLREDLDHVEAAQVGGGRDVDAAVERALAVLDPARPLPIRIPCGNGDGQARGRRAGGDDQVALADVLGLGHEVEEQVAGRALDRADDARVAARGCARRRRSPGR